MNKTNTPQIGNTMIVRGILCLITKILPAGTIEVESLDGKNSYRVSGLTF